MTLPRWLTLAALGMMTACGRAGKRVDPPHIAPSSAAASSWSPTIAAVSTRSSTGSERVPDMLDARTDLRLGHYSTNDGLFGLVLDRSRPVPRAKIDGTTTVFDLAIGRNDGNGISLVSLRGELALYVARSGRLTVSRAPTLVNPRSPLPLRRDRDADPLPELPPSPIDEALLRTLQEEMRAACNNPVGMEVSASSPSPAAQRGLYHGVHRAVMAIRAVCRDDAGKDAVREGLARVRVIVHDQPTPALSLRARTLVVEARFDDEGFGPFAGELQAFIEQRL